MPVLRLGAYNLPAAEVVLVQTLFRLFAHDTSFRWAFVDKAPYDALLVDGTAPESSSAEVGRLTRFVLRLTRMHAPEAPNTLQRPIRADRLHDWLVSVDRSMQQTLSPDAADSLIEQAESLAAATERVLLTSTLRFKLRRWPPGALLRKDPARIRMATLLSRRALSTAELAGLSGQPLEDCQAFMQLLQTTGLVSLQQEPAATAAQPPAADEETPRKSGFGRGLIAGIRRRLGVQSRGAHAS